MSDLFVKKSDYALGLSEHRIIVKNGNREIVREISIHLVENILVFGPAQLSTQLLRELAMAKKNVYYFTKDGRFLFCLDSYRQEDFEKQKIQIQACFQPAFCLALAQKIATAKVKHQLTLLKEFDREGLLSSEDFTRFEQTLDKIAVAESITEIMGYEGRIAKSYFYYLSLLVTDSFRFHGRTRRPAKACFNSILNFGYSFLYSCFLGLIRKNGLSFGFGILHQNHHHHASLASDLMEEWRPIIVDNTVMDLLLHGELGKEHFEKEEDGAVLLTDEGREIFIRALRERMLEIHPYVEGDGKRYSFFYTADQQIKSLIRSFEELDPHSYRTCDTGDSKWDYSIIYQQMRRSSLRKSLSFA